MALTCCTQEIRDAFELFVSDENRHAISASDLARVAQTLSEHPNDPLILAMIEEADKNGDGVVDFDEFYALIRRTPFQP